MTDRFLAFCGWLAWQVRRIFGGRTSAGVGGYWRPFRRVELECMTKGGTLALRIEQPWTFFFTYVEVKAWDGRLLGAIAVSDRPRETAADAASGAGPPLVSAIARTAGTSFCIAA